MSKCQRKANVIEDTAAVVKMKMCDSRLLRPSSKKSLNKQKKKTKKKKSMLKLVYVILKIREESYFASQFFSHQDQFVVPD